MLEYIKNIEKIKEKTIANINDRSVKSRHEEIDRVLFRELIKHLDPEYFLDLLEKNNRVNTDSK